MDYIDNYIPFFPFQSFSDENDAKLTQIVGRMRSCCPILSSYRFDVEIY